MKDQPFQFYVTQMTIRLTAQETAGAYSLVEMRHPEGVALHVHPRSPESFFILEGTYTFYRGEETVEAHPGMAVTIPAGVPHRYLSGPQGGRVLVIVPPGLEEYFWIMAGRLKHGPVPMAEEFALAAELGQEFISGEGHWGGHGTPVGGTR
jgi:mannose-6-phosphate isomerase-like protein (cupin superfamily)